MHIFNKESTDYDIVSDWWTKRGHIIIPKHFLSDYGVINNNAAMWLFPMVTTKCAMIRFPITNPDVSNKERSYDLDLVFDTIHKMSKDMGYNHLFCTTNHEGLIKRLTNYGYTETSDGCKHFWAGV